MPFKFIKNIIKQSNLDITELDDEYRQLKMKNIRKSRQVGDSIQQKTNEFKKNRKIKNRAFETIHKK